MTPLDYLEQLGESIWNDGALCEKCSCQVNHKELLEPTSLGRAAIYSYERTCSAIGEDYDFTKCERLEDVFDAVRDEAVKKKVKKTMAEFDKDFPGLVHEIFGGKK